MKTITKIFAAMAFALPFVNAEAEDYGFGDMGGVFNVSESGAATYTLPFDLPEGINGMVPSLGLVYNSQSGNGVAGMGVSIYGTSVITRTAKDIYHDGTAKGIGYNDNDAYSINGVRLIQKTGGSDFRPENSPADYFMKTTNGFKAELQNGNIAYYEYKAKAGGVAYAWYLSQMVDRYGNVISYSYTTINGCVYLTQVQYGANLGGSSGLSNIVTFEYGSRADAIPYIVNGQSCSMSRRLINVTIKTNNTEWNKYSLTYSNEDAFSRLVKVEVLYGTTKLPPVTLSWNYFNTSITHNTIPFVFLEVTMDNFRDDMFLLSGDIRGLGKSDLIVLDTRFSVISVYERDHSGSFFTQAFSYPLPDDVDLMINTAIKGTYITDYNGDGKNEIILPYFKGQKYGFFINTSSNILHSASWSLNTICEPIHTIGNFYNNGRSQIMFLETIGWEGNGYTGKYYGNIITKTNSASEKKIPFSLILPDTPKNIFASDYNGDGLCDIIIIHNSGYTIFWNQGVAEGEVPFFDDKKTSGNNLKYAFMTQTGDFNGDGLADFLTNDTDENDWFFYLNNGDGNFSQDTACTMDVHDHNFTEKDNGRFSCHVLDFNHDGKDDVVITKAKYTRDSLKDKFQKTYTYWMKSNGSTLTNVTTSSSNNDSDALNGIFTVGDFDGDGIVELMNYGYDCYGNTDTKAKFRIYNISGISANTNKVSKISIGEVGTTTNITYSTLADAGLYIKGSGNYYPLVDLQVPLNVVNKVIQSISTDSYTTTYKYSGLRAHLQGRGMLGFTSIVANNSTINEKRTTTINSLNQTYYEPSKVTTTITKGNKTATTETTFDVKNCYEYVKCHFTYPQTIKQTGFYGEVETTTNKYDNSYRLTEQLANYDVANMYRQVKYSSFVKAGGVYKPETVMTTQKHKDDAQTFTTKTTYKYESNGKVAKMVENDSTERPVTHKYSYNKFGNLKTHTVSASDISTVTTTYSYEVTNRFADTVSSSANNLITAYTYNKLGRMTKMQEGLRGSLLTTSYIQDRVGNLLRVTHPDGTTTNYTRSWGNSVFMAYSVTTTTTGQAPVTTWYDNAGREVLSSTTGAKGVTFTNSTSYDFINGNVSTQSRSIGSISLTDYYTYDNMGQLTKSVTGTGQTTTFSYSKRSVAASQGNGKYLSKIYDPWGNLTTVSHNQCSSASYKIASNGQPTSINYNDASGQSYTVATMAYDKRGLQSSLTDVDAGKTSYVYDALGRVTKQTDARRNITTNTYNASGLLIKQVCGGVTTTYEYDSNLRLKKETTGSQSISYTYDKYNRLTKKSYSIDGTALIFSYTYNSNGQMATQTFPDGMIETYTYDANGYLTLITMGGQKVWELKSNTGTQRTVHLGTTPLVLTTSYDFNGLPKSSIMKRGSTTLHSFGYTFDGATGNLKSRTGMQSGTENFTYDAFDRLTTGTSYSVNGNIASKNGIGKYTYDANKKHAVVQVQNTSNLIQGAASLTYNAFNKVATVVQGTNTLTITYGPDRQRTKTVLVNGSNTTTTLYADNYEQRTTNGVTKSYHYVASPDGLAAVYVKSGNTATAYYIETDHLGSIVRAYDYLGNIKFSAAYDAWGNQTVFTNAIGLTRGYTGHEHWNQFGLIDMNGRFYDPLIGRFLSPDPYVQAPYNLQNFNRYSYCLNNPLKYTDPSGNIVMTATVMGIFISAYMGAIINAGTQGVAGNVNSVGDFLRYSGIGSLAGFAGGYVGVAVSGLGNIASSAISCAVSNSINGAGITWANGGSFSEGLAAGGLGGLSGGISGGLTSAALGGASALLATGGFNGEINVPRAELQSFDDCPIMNSTMLEEVTITAKAGSYAAAQQNIINQINGIFNINAAVNNVYANSYANVKLAKEKEGGYYCGRHILRAIEAGFNKENLGFTGYVKTWGNRLQELGFSPINTSEYKSGDIAIFQGPGGSVDRNGIPYGHIQMYDGNHKQWISFWKQASFFPGNGYVEQKSPYQIYRWR